MNVKNQAISFLIRGIAFVGLGLFMAISEFLLSDTPPNWKAWLSFPLGVYGLVRLIGSQTPKGIQKITSRTKRSTRK